ncbi:MULTISPECIES: hypothetical protein [unclassified Mesorhizobium]|uniref:hypothetical protein n=1 Tax=unclassified Mesorhizobium TaxID=325217 RepID=UPI000FDA25AB|nr:MULTISPECIES: hypothetical protein [unclassified Mesorhizobium]TGT76189.1 hypothetical protein EN809_000765 [Mesorhizobium sp. M2E.F.Ca.ET.166.01.1.1]TGW02304.1 hypothetical protein EN797_000765 [Mesorhizobium sp. M2E.F.Ca.ET.154.01.1.1]
MRAASTYRAARRERAKAEAREAKQPFSTVWPTYKLKAKKGKSAETYRPAVVTGKYAPHQGLRECARRARQTEQHP